MKNVFLFIFLFASSAFADLAASLDCRVGTSSGSTRRDLFLPNGIPDRQSCDAYSCPKDPVNFSFAMTFFAGSKSISLDVFDHVSKFSVKTNYKDIRVGSIIEFETYSPKTNAALTISCTVAEIKNATCCGQ